MPVTIKIIGLNTGMETPFDSQYVVEYDPGYHLPNGEYDGGKLITTPDITKARQFENASEALNYWRQDFGLREDAQPNRPLTAFSVEVE